MPNHFQNALEQKKDDLIVKLLDRGIYKTKNHQLYELSLSELERAYRQLSKTN
ncbi:MULTISPECIES: Fur-regulated basic protein FbpA [unclassified Sporolactobacillus]|uniref:Fur-regulated basic protein FbpA n=1 Tax=unclassified Sporolactobacillus TaxID=2628533 RepID=UPI002368B2A0|nr:Fur-regulated basic protein FbpA [Sporolactobacillus sp. CQH2019]MDD9147248.1 Fur-regulated basic protein FbpA [Sporolactobacillus sp. CQH2019]